jgi:hypothetical protein
MVRMGSGVQIPEMAPAFCTMLRSRLQEASPELLGFKSRRWLQYNRAGLVKRSNTRDCKSLGLCLRRFESYTLHQNVSIMNKKIINYAHCIVLAALIIFTAALAINNYNSGVYADAHALDGASVGWFAPNGVLIFVLSVVITVSYLIYLAMNMRKKQ